LVAVFLGVFYSRQVPFLGVVIGLGVGAYGGVILVNVRGMRDRILFPTGRQQRPNGAPAWIAGSLYLILGLALIGSALARL
jgi:hypothetical protein